MEYYPTRHAVEAMTSRSITWAEVLWVLQQPEVTYRSDTGKHAGKDTSIKQRGSLYVVVANQPDFSQEDSSKQFPLHAVITIGLRSTLVWNNTDAIARNRCTTVTEATT
jgi:hypothetical protein